MAPVHYRLRPIKEVQFGFAHFVSHFIRVQIFQINFSTLPRVVKCHGYGGYIHVKNCNVGGKKSGGIHSFAKSSIVLGKCEQLI